MTNEDRDDAARRRAFAQVLQARRKQTGMSLSEVARAAGIAKSNLSRLESGEGNPSLETLWALSGALNVSVSDLIDQPGGQARLVRRGEASDLRADAADYGVTLLSRCPAGATRDLYRVAFQPGARKVSAPHATARVEHIVLLSGRARVGPVGAEEDLLPGDYLTFPAAREHVYEALEPDTEALVVIESG
ncbi:helix-turn-helix domain-containing protein [Thalassobaculum salexigens]|uniref:helix-turn-helix domain-containing protein n=1 Tax=Thalassobaculum salexigens TaxID=455360 RepID=UPI00042817FC|nr:XRE family transcriptional regulator [Thalassobaculum salexigens]